MINLNSYKWGTPINVNGLKSPVKKGLSYWVKVNKNLSAPMLAIYYLSKTHLKHKDSERWGKKEFEKDIVKVRLTNDSWIAKPSNVY